MVSIKGDIFASVEVFYCRDHQSFTDSIRNGTSSIVLSDFGVVSALEVDVPPVEINPRSEAIGWLGPLSETDINPSHLFVILEGLYFARHLVELIEETSVSVLTRVAVPDFSEDIDNFWAGNLDRLEFLNWSDFVNAKAATAGEESAAFLLDLELNSKLSQVKCKNFNLIVDRRSHICISAAFELNFDFAFPETQYLVAVVKKSRSFLDKPEEQLEP